MVHGIVSPIGGIANHIRWLILLSKEYNNLLTDLPFSMGSSLEDKVRFIKQVYNDRSYYNWIITEYEHRNPLHEIFPMYHSHNRIDQHLNKLLLCLVDEKNAWYHYIKFNPLCNGQSKDLFLTMVQAETETKLEWNIDKNFLCLFIDDLYGPVLNEEVYLKIINYFNIENCYDSAQNVHELWYNMQEKFRQEVVADVKKGEFKWMFPDQKEYSEDEKKYIKQIILEEYDDKSV